LGFSHNGYNGPYETAITADGQIVADFITSGSLVANIIKAGVIQSQDGSSWWDLESGEVVLRAYVSTDEFAEKTAYLQQNADGLNSYVATLTETMESVSDSQEKLEERLKSSESKVSQLQHIEYHGKRSKNFGIVLGFGRQLAVQLKRRCELDDLFLKCVNKRKHCAVFALAEHKLHGEDQGKAAVQPCLRHIRQCHRKNAWRCRIKQRQHGDGGQCHGYGFSECDRV